MLPQVSEEYESLHRRGSAEPRLDIVTDAWPSAISGRMITRVPVPLVEEYDNLAENVWPTPTLKLVGALMEDPVLS